MDYPIPTHLQQFFVLIGDENSEYETTGTIRCSCGNERFLVTESNERHIVNLVCGECGKEILLFDAGQHGWDGFVCNGDYLDRTLSLQKYNCPKCGEECFKVSVRISSQGKQDFLDECVANDNSFSIDDWVNGFEWITIALSCKKCSFRDDEWVDLETM